MNVLNSRFARIAGLALAGLLLLPLTASATIYTVAYCRQMAAQMRAKAAECHRRGVEMQSVGAGSSSGQATVTKEAGGYILYTSGNTANMGQAAAYFQAEQVYLSAAAQYDALANQAAANGGSIGNGANGLGGYTGGNAPMSKAQKFVKGAQQIGNAWMDYLAEKEQEEEAARQQAAAEQAQREMEEQQQRLQQQLHDQAASLATVAAQQLQRGDIKGAEDMAKDAWNIDHENGSAPLTIGLAELILNGDNRDPILKSIGLMTAFMYLNSAIKLMPDNADAIDARGMAWMKDDNWDKAEADFTTALQLAPNSQSARDHLALVHQHRNDVVQQQKEAEERLARAKALVEEGRKKLAAKDYNGALPLLAEAIKLDEKSGYARLLQGMALYEKEKWGIAVWSFNSAIELQPTWQAYALRGYAKVKQDEDNDAVDDFNQALKLNPNNSELRADLARAQKRVAAQVHVATAQQCRNSTRAIQEYTEAIKIDDKDARAYLERAYVYANRGEDQEALADYARAIAADRTNLNTWTARARFYIDHGQPEKALGDYTQAIAADENNMEAWETRARFYVDQKRLKEADADYTKAIALSYDSDSSEREPYAARAEVRMALRDFDGAIADYSHLIDLDPDNPHGWETRADAFKAQGLAQKASADRAQAETIYTKAVDASSRSYERVAALQARARFYEKQERLQEAEADYTTRIALAQGDCEAWTDRAQFYVNHRRLKEAEADYTKAISLNQKNSFNWADRARFYEDNGRLKEAEADYTKIISINEKNADSWGTRAKFYSDHDRVNEAEADYTKAVSLAGITDSADDILRIYYLRLRATFYSDHGRDQAAEADYAQILKLSPEDGDAAAGLANVQQHRKDVARAAELVQEGQKKMDQQDWDAALKVFTEAIRLDDKNALAWFKRQWAYVMKRDWKRAIEDGDRVVVFYPHDPYAVNNRGWAKENAGDWAGAEADYTQALKLNPNNEFKQGLEGGLARVHRLIESRAHFKDGQDDDDEGAKIKDYSEALKLDDKYVEAYLARAQAYEGQQQPDDALADYTRIIALDDKNTTAYLGRGNIYREINGHEQEALADYTKAIALEGDNKRAYFARGEVRMALLDLDGARADFTRAIELDDADSAAYLSRAEVRLALHDADGAIADYSRVIELDPSFVSWEERGDAYIKLKRFPEALADYTKAIGLIDKTDKEQVPLLSHTCLTRAKIRLVLNDWDGAGADCSQVISLAADSVMVKEAQHQLAIEREKRLAYEHGRALRAAGDFVGADTEFKKALALSADFSDTTPAATQN